MFTIVYFSMDQILCHAIPSCFDSSGVFIFIFIFFKHHPAILLWR